MQECGYCGSGLELESYQNAEDEVIVVLICPDCDRVYPVKTKTKIKQLLKDEDYSRYMPVDVLINLSL